MTARRIRPGVYVMRQPSGEYFIERRAGGTWWVTGFDPHGMVTVSDGLWSTKAAAERVVPVYDAYFRFANIGSQS